MFCSNCGTQVYEGAKFCGSCGSPVLTVNTAAAAVPAQQEPMQQIPAQQEPMQQIPVQQEPMQQIPAQHESMQQEPVQQGPSVMLSAGEAEYTVYGEEFQYAEVLLRPGESFAANAGALLYMSSDIDCASVSVPDILTQADGSLIQSNESTTEAGKVMNAYTNSGSENVSAAFTLPEIV